MTATDASPVSGVTRGLCAAAILACAGLVAPAGAKNFNEDDVAAAVTALIAERAKDGVLSVRDPKTGTTLPLVLDNVRIA